MAQAEDDEEEAGNEDDEENEEVSINPCDDATLANICMTTRNTSQTIQSDILRTRPDLLPGMQEDDEVQAT